MTDELPQSNILPGFNLAALRIDPSALGDTIGVKQILTAISYRRAKKHEFIRVNSDPAYTLDTLLLLVKGEEEETYLVAPELREYVGEDLQTVRIYTAQNRAGSTFLMGVPLPGPDGKHNIWHRTRLEAAELAKTGWIRLSASKTSGTYDVFRAEGLDKSPIWPEKSFEELLQIAFRHNYIDSPDHPALKALRGLI